MDKWTTTQTSLGAVYKFPLLTYLFTYCQFLFNPANFYASVQFVLGDFFTHFCWEIFWHFLHRQRSQTGNVRKRDAIRILRLTADFPRTVAGTSRTSCRSSFDLLSHALTWNTLKSPVSMLRISTLEQMLQLTSVQSYMIPVTINKDYFWLSCRENIRNWSYLLN